MITMSGFNFTPGSMPQAQGQGQPQGQTQPQAGFTFSTNPAAAAPSAAPAVGGFSFGNQSAAQPAGSAANTTTGATLGLGGFGSTAKPGAGGFPFGTPGASATPGATAAGLVAPAASTAPAPSFNFGGTGGAGAGGAAAAGGAGFTLGSAATATAPAAKPQLQLGVSSVAAAPQPGPAAPTSSTGFLLGGVAPVASTQASSLTQSLGSTSGGGFGVGGTAPIANTTGFSLGGATTAAVKPVSLGAATGGLGGLGGATAGFKLGGTTAATATPGASTLGFSQPTAAKTTATGLVQPQPAAATATATAAAAAPAGTLKFSIPASSTSAAPSKFGLTGLGTSTTSTATTLGIGGLSAASTAPAALTTSTTTTASSAAPPAMNYRQLEEAINKWTLDLEDQEKVFLQQATQVNAWDNLLIENGEKITQLNTDVERVKIDQQRLEQELDFIHCQQKELEELLAPLEQAVEQLPPINYQQHADVEREITYKLAENIDAQLKRMVQDLKEIIEHLNTNSSGQDSTDPVCQIAKILNAHMDSLQWVDQNTTLLQRKVDEVAKQAELRRKDQERNFRLAYD